MSTTIDQRVVEMRFDNAQFERETRNTMSTLDRLKQSLNLTGASKGLENINSAAKNNNMSVLGGAVESVGAKFSAMQVVGITALANITNQAVNAGKRIAAAFTIDPIKTGFNEYELKMGSIQTIMASTGESLDTVNGYLNELNEYSDKTIYSFSDMTTNIGKFTNAGVKLEDAVMAIKGISNEAAVSGANANEASRAMYNFAQALSAGFVKLIDWKSIENANMATVEFKNQLIEAAVAAGTLKKSGDGMYEVVNVVSKANASVLNATHNFNDSLGNQWMTTEVLINTLKEYASETTDIGKKAYAAAQDVKTFSMMMDTLKESAQSGWAQTWELIVGDFEEAKVFFTKLTESIGGFIDGMSDYRNNLLGGILTSNYDKLISEINKAGKSTEEFEEKLRSVVKASGMSSKHIDELIDKYGSLSKAAKAGYIPTRMLKKALKELGIGSSDSNSKLSGFIDKLKEIERMLGFGSIGDDVKTLQSALEELGYSVGECKIDGIIGPDTTKAIKEFQKAAGIAVDGIAGPETLAALEKAGTSVGELSESVKETSVNYEDLIDNITDKGGRELLLEGFANVVESLMGVFKALGTAWSEIFPAEEIQEKILKMLELFNNFSQKLKLTKEVVDENGVTITVLNENGEKLMKTFKGVFAIFDIISTIASGPMIIAFKTLKTILSVLDIDILKSTSTIADAIVKFRDWIKATLDFNKIFETIRPYIESVTEVVDKWIKANIDLSACLDNIKDRLGKVKKAIDGWFEGLRNTDDVHQYIIDGIVGALIKVKDFVVNALKNLKTSIVKGMDNVLEAMLIGWDSIPNNITEGFNEGFLVGIASIIKNIRKFCKKFIDTVKGMFGIHSPSVVMYEIGQNIIQGFLNGITSMLDLTVSAVKNFFSKTRDGIEEIDFGKPLDFIISGIKKFGSKVAEVFGTIDFGKIFAAALGVGMLVVAKKAIDVLEMFGNPLEGLGDMLSGIGEAFEGFGKNLKASAMMKRAKSLLIISGAIMVLVMAILPLTELSWGQLAKAGVSLVVLSGIVVGLYALLNLIGTVDTKSLGSSAKLILVAGSLFLLAFAIKSLSKIALEGDIDQTIKMLATTIGSLAGLMIAFGLFVNADKANNIDKAGVMIFKIAAALLTITTVIKIVSGFTYSDITKGLTFILGVGLLFTAITAISKFSGEHADKAGVMMLKMSIAMMIMAGVIKIVSGMSEDDIKKGQAFIVGVGKLFAALTLISLLSGKNADLAGKMLFKMGIAMLLMVSAIKMVAGMNSDDIKKGIGVVSAISVLFAGIVAVSKFAGQHAIKAGVLLLAMSAALLIMVGITFIVSKLDQKEMWKAVGFVAALEAMFAGLIYITKYAKATDKLKTTLILFLIAIGLMVAAVIGLSFIDPKSLATATAALSGVMGMFAALMVATKFTKNTKDMRKTLWTLLGVTVVLAGIIFALSKLNPESALEVSGSLSLLLLSFSSSIFILGHAGRISKTAINALKPMLGIALGLALIVAAFAVLKKYGMESSIQSVMSLNMLLNAFATSIVILGKAGSVSKSSLAALKPMLVVAAGLGVILAVFAVLNKYGMDASIQSALSLSILLNAFASSIVILGQAGRVSTSAVSALNPMLIVAAGLGAILAVFGVLNKYGIEPSISSAIALGILLNAFSAAIVILGATGPGIISALPALQPMVLVVVELAVILGLMSALNVEASIPSAIALGVLLNLLATSMVILGFVGPTATAAIPAAIGMGLVIGELALAMGIMAKMNVQSAIPYAISLSILLVALTAAIGLLGLIAPVIPAAIPAVLGLGIVVAELAVLLAALGGLAQIPGLQWLITEGGNFLQSIGKAIGQFVGGLLGGIVSGAAESLPSLGISLSMFMSTVQSFITGAQGITEDVLTGVKYLSAAILLLLGTEFLSGIALLTGSSLVGLGYQLSGFIVAAAPFLTSIQSIDPGAVEAAKTLAEMILILTAAEMISGITSFVGGNTDFTSFGEQLKSFGSAVCEFSNILTANGGIDEKAVTSAANAGKVMAELQDSLYGSGGFKQDLFGEKDLSSFGTQLVAFGQAICAFSNTLVQNGGIDEKAVTSAANAGKTIAELQNALYGSGGLKQDIFGEKDLALFSTQLIAFGQAICGFSNTIRNNGGIDEEAVTSAANAGKLMAALQNEITASGGFKQDLFGEQNLETFGAQIKSFGQAIVDFSKIVTGNINEEAVTAASTAGRVMAQVQAAIPEDKWFDGKISIDDFGKKIVKFGEGIAKYSKEVAEINVSAVNSSLYAAKSLVSIAKSVIDLDTSGMETFKDVKSIGSTIKGYYQNIVEIDFSTISSSILSVRSLISMIKNMVGLDTSGISSFKSAISSLASTDMAGFTNAFKDTGKFASVGVNIVNAIKNGMMTSGDTLTHVGIALVDRLVLGMTSRSTSTLIAVNTIINNISLLVNSKKETFNSLGVLLMSKFISGITSQSYKVRSAVSSSVSLAATSIRNHYSSFYNAGSYLVDGFCDGISANSYKAVNAATSMAKAAAKAAEAALQINSPSKVFRAIGYSVPEGFAMGIDRLAYLARNSARSMTDVAIDGVKNSIYRIAEAVNTDIDTQPTIRPVLDLSDVESGAGAISGLFSNTASVGVMANVGSINTMMNRRSQNGANGDVISAIDKLRDKLNNVGNTYYTIDGITYSNGTEVADAITSLTRAIKMEGRV